MDETPREVLVVEASDDDVPAIGSFFWAMWHEAGADAPGFTGATEEIIAEIAAPDAIRSRIGGPERRMFLAYRGGQVVGFAAAKTRNEDEIELAGIVVLQAMVGSGVGTSLVQAAVQACRKLGFAKMTVSTEVDNQRAVAFYQARGFRLAGESTAEVAGTVFAVTNLSLDL
ncbi:MAG: GNAT family N-acetyltransferase [Acidimicrobiia bacterium]|nr:GNAT family N-acetyltransferase [Acidimicrobiia bacterium]